MPKSIPTMHGFWQFSFSVSEDAFSFSFLVAKKVASFLAAFSVVPKALFQMENGNIKTINSSPTSRSNIDCVSAGVCANANHELFARTVNVAQIVSNCMGRSGQIVPFVPNIDRFVVVFFRLDCIICVCHKSLDLFFQVDMLPSVQVTVTGTLLA